MSAVFDGSVVAISERVTPAIGSSLAVQIPHWCLVRRDDEDLFLISGEELMGLLEKPSTTGESP